MKGSSYNENEVDYYGIIEEILEFTYLGFNNKVILLKCHWFDPNSIRIDKLYGIVELKHKSKLNAYEPFILAEQAQQVYFTKYPTSKNKERSDWWAVCKVKARLYSDVQLEDATLVEKSSNTDYFQTDEADLLPCTDAFILESHESVRLCDNDELQEVNPTEIYESGRRTFHNSIVEDVDVDESEENSNDEEEMLSEDDNEDDDENELDISSSSENEMDLH